MQNYRNEHNKIEDHPTVQLHGEIQKLCHPLKHLKISYFCHVKINADNEFSALSNNPDYHRFYLQNAHYNSDIHMAKKKSIGEYFIWDLANITGKSMAESKIAANFGVNHVFTITSKNNKDADYYHFATYVNNSDINHQYINKLQMLKAFIAWFNQKVILNTEMLTAYQSTFLVDTSQGVFECTSMEEYPDVSGFYRDINMPTDSGLTMQQLSILKWLHHGKTISDIASLMGIADITVNKHIANIKKKFSCYTQFQLGELYERLGL